MGMRTRREYLGFLAATGLLAAVGGTVALSAGCGGGTPENTRFFGSYTGIWRVFVPSNVSPTNCTGTSPFDGQLSFSVDEKGRIRGSVFNPYGLLITSLNPDQSAGNLTGSMDNSGKFYGQINYANGRVCKIEGALSIQPNTVEQDPIFSATTPNCVVSLDAKAAKAAATTDRAAQTRQTASPTPSPTPTPASTFKEGLVGNFRETIDGVTYNGFFDSEGGPTAG